tara:strand:- start:486 stop:686 length:201 start_codon:yes stop_codon:yes gene_type:complete
MKELMSLSIKNSIDLTLPLDSPTQETTPSEECLREFPSEWHWIQGFMKNKLEPGPKQSSTPQKPLV